MSEDYQQYIKNISCEETALKVISGLAREFGLVGCGYWGKADMERELDKRLSHSDYKMIRRQWNENVEPTCFEDEMRWHL